MNRARAPAKLLLSFSPLLHSFIPSLLSTSPTLHISTLYISSFLCEHSKNPRHHPTMPRKKALLIGINYTGTPNQLNGCINDAMNVREFLVRDRGFSPDQRDMVILTDDPRNRGTPFFPTGHNMLAAFKWLVTCNNPGDSLWLSYSGHGSMSSSLILERTFLT